MVTGGQILSGVGAKAAIAVTSLAEAFISLVGIVTYLVVTGGVDWRLGLALMTGALISTPLSAWTVKKVHIRHMRLIVGVAACVLGVLTMLRVAAH